MSKPATTTPRKCGRCTDQGADTTCRICHKPLCDSCTSDHHHEGYGTPADDCR